MACISGQYNVIELLLEKGADPNVRDIHIFLSSYYVLYYFYWSPLHRAVLWSHISIIKLLLAHGVDPKAADDNGITILY